MNLHQAKSFTTLCASILTQILNATKNKPPHHLKASPKNMDDWGDVLNQERAKQIYVVKSFIKMRSTNCLYNIQVLYSIGAVFIFIFC